MLVQVADGQARAGQVVGDHVPGAPADEVEVDRDRGMSERASFSISGSRGSTPITTTPSTPWCLRAADGRLLPGTVSGDLRSRRGGGRSRRPQAVLEADEDFLEEQVLQVGVSLACVSRMTPITWERCLPGF